MSFLPLRDDALTALLNAGEASLTPTGRGFHSTDDFPVSALCLTTDDADGLPGFLASVLSDEPEAAERLAQQQQAMEEEEEQQRHVRNHDRDLSPHCLAVPVGLSEADKRRTLSDALAIRRGAAAMASDCDASTSTPFWLEAGMRPAINRLCSVVLHAVGTAQLDLLRKCQASADQLQAHFRIPPWQSESPPPSPPPPASRPRRYRKLTPPAMLPRSECRPAPCHDGDLAIDKQRDGRPEPERGEGSRRAGASAG